MWHVLSSTAFCMRMYRPGRRWSNFKLTCNLFGIVPVVGATNSTILLLLPPPFISSVSILSFQMTSPPLAVFFLDCSTFEEEGAALRRNGWKHPPNDI